MRVRQPGANSPAFYYCKYPVRAPRRFGLRIAVPYAKQDPREVGSLALECLALPEWAAQGIYELLPDDIDVGLQPFWAPAPDSPLLVPKHYIDRQSLRDRWSVATYLTLADCGIPCPDDAVAQTCWWVLARAGAEAVAPLLTELAWIADVSMASPSVLQNTVKALDLQPRLRSALVAQVDGDKPLLLGRAILWVLRELAAADEHELEERRRWHPGYDDEASLLAWSCFGGLAAGKNPTSTDVFVAVWMLHQTFHGFEELGDPASSEIEELLLSITAAVGFRQTGRPTWAARIERWFRIWSLPDDSPHLDASKVLPSELRSAFEVELGVSPVEWLSGCWVIVMRWFAAVSDETDHQITGFPVDLFTLPAAGRQGQLSDAFKRAFTNQMVTTLADLGVASRREVGTGYTGLGTLPQTDSLATRNRPVLELPDGRWMPMGLSLTAERATDLYRFLFSRDRRRSGVGHLFEAYANGLIADMSQHARLVTEQELALATARGRQHADSLLAHGNDYLAIEISVQTLLRGVAEGRHDKIQAMAERYQREADQAAATLADLEATTKRLGLVRPATSSFLVVTDDPIAHSPPLINLLARLRPGRTGKFLCSIDDLEHLAALGRRGWSVPGIISNWQATTEPVPLSHHLSKHTAMTGVADQDASDIVSMLVDHLPQQPDEPAA